jgi:hypothetical protein
MNSKDDMVAVRSRREGEQGTPRKSAIRAIAPMKGWVGGVMGLMG